MPEHDFPPRDWRRFYPFARGSAPVLLAVTGLWLAGVALGRRLAGRLPALPAAALTAVWGLVLFFFRDPERAVTAAPDQVLSPADGKVVAVARPDTDSPGPADGVRLSIFLSLFDVHVQRAPMAGVVTAVTHRPGGFVQAYRPEASTQNEAINMDLETAHGPLGVTQIAGILARRCVNFARPGQQLAAGQRYGLIRFGSRVDLFIPPRAWLMVQVGDRVTAGITVVAVLPPAGATATPAPGEQQLPASASGWQRPRKDSQ